MIARQQRAGIAHNKSRQQVDERKEVLFRHAASPGIAQEIEIRQTNHHDDPVRSYLFRVVQQRGQLIIKEQAVIQTGFVILRGIGADQRIHTAALIAGELNF